MLNEVKKLALKDVKVCAFGLSFAVSLPEAVPADQNLCAAGEKVQHVDWGVNSGRTEHVQETVGVGGRVCRGSRHNTQEDLLK